MMVLPRLLLVSARGLRILLFWVWLQALIALLHRPKGGTSLMVDLMLKVQRLLHLGLLLGATD
jgi:hypothetical protein